jgi:nucleotide-binding universal stress UspA family protein
MALPSRGPADRSAPQRKAPQVLDGLEFNCDLLVMGAYAHSRLRQQILGGVTRHILEHATLPVMMHR